MPISVSTEFSTFANLIMNLYMGFDDLLSVLGCVRGFFHRPGLENRQLFSESTPSIINRDPSQPTVRSSEDPSYHPSRLINSLERNICRIVVSR